MKVVVKTLDSQSAFVFTGVGHDAGFILSDTILRIVGTEHVSLTHAPFSANVPCTKYFPVARLVSITKTLEEGEVA